MTAHRTVLVALVGASMALGACARERHTDRDPAHAPAATESNSSSNGDDALSPSPAHSIIVVPASENLISRAAAGGAIIRKLLEAAKPSLGTPYKWGGTDLTSGIDCSNFTWLLYRSIGVPYDRYIRTRELATLRRNAGFSQTTFADARPGDLLVYGYRDDGGDWHGHVVILVDMTGQFTGQPGLVLGAHGTPVSAVQFVTAAGFAQGWFKTPEMRLLNVLRPVDPTGAR